MKSRIPETFLIFLLILFVGLVHNKRALVIGVPDLMTSGLIEIGLIILLAIAANILQGILSRKPQ